MAETKTTEVTKETREATKDEPKVVRLPRRKPVTRSGLRCC